MSKIKLSETFIKERVKDILKDVHPHMFIHDGIDDTKNFTEYTKKIYSFLSISKKEILLYLTKNKINYAEDDSNSNSKFDRNFLRNEIFPLLEKRWKSFPNRINNMTSIIKERNDDYFELINNKYNELIDSEIEIKKLKKIPNSVVRDILRFSIKKSNLSLPNTKIMNEIIKTFLKSSPGPKSIVSWSRSDREELAGQITFKNGFLIISKDNRRNDES